MHRDVVRINGVDIDLIKPEEVRERFRAFLDEARPHHVATVNPEFLAAVEEDERFRTDLNSADLALPDGIGVVFASWLLGKKIPARITGHDAVAMLAEISEETGARVFIFGGYGSRAHRAAAALKQKYPRMHLVGADTEHRFWGWKIPEHTIRRRIAQASPEIIFVAMGAGKQERWLRRNLPHLLSVRIGIGIGGVIDILSGDLVRAPLWMRRLGLEWAHRLLQEPQRSQRIMTATLRFPISVIRFWYSKS